MRLVFIIGGAVATTGMLIISMWLNYLFGSGLGQTPMRAVVFGCVSIIVDAWKGLGPIYILSLVRARRIPSAGAAIAVWFVCFLYSISSAIGIVVQDRATRTTGREMARATYGELQGRLEDLQGRRKIQRVTRSSGEIDAAIQGVLIRPVSDRGARSIGLLSNNCARTDGRTASACGEVAVLRQELAASREAARIDAEIGELQNSIVFARDGGAALPSDPQGETFSRLTNGRLTSTDVGFALALLLTAAIELISAFGPAVIAAFADASTKGVSGGAPPEVAHVGGVLDYLADRVEPADASARIDADQMYRDYVQWCAKGSRAAMSATDFVGAFDRSRVAQGIRQIKKVGRSYYGIRLVMALV